MSPTPNGQCAQPGRHLRLYFYFPHSKLVISLETPNLQRSLGKKANLTLDFTAEQFLMLTFPCRLLFIFKYSQVKLNLIKFSL